MASRDQVIGLVIFAIGALILFGQKVASLLYTPLFLIVVSLVVLVVVLIFRYKKVLKITIENFEVKDNITLTKVNDKQYYVLAFKVDVKVDPAKDKTYTFKNYLLFLKTIEKRAGNDIKVVLVNNIYPRPSTYVIILKEKGSDINNDIENLTNFAIQLKTIMEGLEDGIQLNPVKVVGDYITIPTGLGAIVYPTVLGSTVKMPESPYIYQSVRSEKFIEIGQTPDGKPVGITEEELSRHIAVFGATGSGKTNTAILLASQVAHRGYTVIVFDWYGEYSAYLRDFIHLRGDSLPRINPLGLSKIEEISDLLGTVLDLTEPQKFLLYLLLAKLRAVGRFELPLLIDLLREIEDTNSWIRDVKYALLRKIILMFSEEGRKLFSSDGMSLEDLGAFFENKKVIVDLSSIEGDTLKRLYALFILLFLAYYQMRRRDSGKTFIIIDESQNYFMEGKNAIIDKILREYRKFGIALCLVTQSPSSVSDDVLKNTSVKIIHSVKSNIDKKIISESTALPKELIDYLDKLDPGLAICSCSSEKVPIIVNIKKVQ